MRNELQQIQTIEQYLNGQMSPEEKARFENNLDHDPALRQEVQWQREIMEGIHRAGLRQQIRQARARSLRQQYLKWGATGVLGALLAITWWHAAIQNNLHPRQSPETIPPQSSTPSLNQYTAQPIASGDTSQPLPLTNEGGATTWSTPDRRIPAQLFQIDTRHDTVIITRDGLTLAIPANAWIDQEGAPIQGIVQLACKEALDAGSIIRAGLSTRAGNQVLETGGMFMIDARLGDKTLQISPQHPLYAGIPTDTIKPGMQLYKGQRLQDGSIDWTAPRPLAHNLTEINIRLLDFYPPGYIDSLKNWGLNYSNKIYTDSLYYGLAYLFSPNQPSQQQPQSAQPAQNQLPQQRRQPKPDTTVSPQRTTRRNRQKSRARQSPYPSLAPRVYRASDTIPDYAASASAATSSAASAAAAAPVPRIPCGINPAKIQAIRDDAFQHTLLATREFEERMPWIHRSANPKILDLYINHLDWPLWKIDSLAATLLPGEQAYPLKKKFESFASRRDGRLTNAPAHAQQMLAEFYAKRTRVLTETITRTQQEYWNREHELETRATAKQEAYLQDSLNNLNHAFAEELNHNLKNACIQLGYRPYEIGKIPESVPKNLLRKKAYIAEITTTGWCNIDRATVAATLNGTTLDFTDPTTGRKAHIDYKMATFTISNAAGYDRMDGYILPMEFNTFLHLKDSAGVYRESLNTSLRNQLLFIGYKGKQAYYFTQSDIIPRDYSPITVQPIDSAALDQLLARIGTTAQSKQLQKDNNYFQFEISDRPRRMRIEALRNLQTRIEKIIFPCLITPEEPAPKPIGLK